MFLIVVIGTTVWAIGRFVLSGSGSGAINGTDTANNKTNQQETDNSSDNALAIAVQHVKDTPVSIAALRPDIPVELSQIIEQMMASGVAVEEVP